LQGLGEVLEHYLISRNIGIPLTYPLDMLNTPGFVEGEFSFLLF
jgi:hypothetical protein